VVAVLVDILVTEVLAHLTQFIRLLMEVPEQAAVVAVAVPEVVLTSVAVAVA
jgi:hypothetical protein